MVGEGKAVGKAEGSLAVDATEDRIGGREFVVDLARGTPRAADKVGKGVYCVVQGVGEVAEGLFVRWWVWVKLG